MLFKRSLYLGILAGLLSALGCVVYTVFIWKDQYQLDYFQLISWWNLLASCMLGCLLAALGHWAAIRAMPKYGEFAFNMLFSMLTFASLLGPIGYTWPVDVTDEIQMLTEYFAFYAMPLHFFPALVWFTLRPLFFSTTPVR